MKKRLKEIQSRAIKAREKLTYDNPEERKHIGKLDMVIRGTTYVKWMLMFSLGFFIVFFIASMLFSYPKIDFMLTFFGISVIGGVGCWFIVLMQAKLYDRAINKTQQLLSSGRKPN